MKHLRSASLVAILALLIWGCAADEVTPPTGLVDPGLSNVRTENSSARQSTIDAGGGTLSASGSNGAIYTLTVPADAVDSGVKISMYPITAISGSPFGDKLAGGVHLEPEGFIPNVPMTLTIDLPTDHDPRLLAGIASEGNAEGMHPFPTSIAGRRVTFTITHFSQYATGDATLDALIDMPVSSTRAQNFQTDLAFHYYLWQRDGVNPNDKYVTTMSQWYSQYLLPKLNSFITTSDYSVIVRDRPNLVKDYNAWLAGIDFCMATAQGPLDLTSVVGQTVRVAVALSNGIFVACNEIGRLAGSDPNGPSDAVFSDMIGPAGVALALQFQADVWNFDSRENQLDKESVLGRIPLKVVIQSRTLPDDFARGSSGPLNIRAGVAIIGRATRFSIPVEIKLFNVSPSTVSPATGRTDASGNFRTTVQWTSGNLNVDMLAYLKHPAGERYSVAVFDRLTREASQGTLSGVWRKMDHIWRYNDGAQEMGIHLLSRIPGMLEAIQPREHAPNRNMFNIPIQVNGDSFTGDATITGANFVFNGWRILVTGERRDDGALDFTWQGTEVGGTRTVSGSDVIPPA